MPSGAVGFKLRYDGWAFFPPSSVLSVYDVDGPEGTFVAIRLKDGGEFAVNGSAGHVAEVIWPTKDVDDGD